MKIKTRMFVGIAGAILFLLVSNFIAQYIFQQTSHTIEHITQVQNQKLKILNHLKGLVDERAILFRDLVIYEDGDLKTQSRSRLTETSAEIGKILDELKNMHLNEAETQLYDQLLNNVSSANQSFGSFAMAADEGFIEEAVDVMVNEFNPKFSAFSEIVSEFKNLEEQLSAQSVQKLREQKTIGTYTLWAVLIVSIIMFTVGGILVANSLLKPINAIRKTVAHVKETGELEHRVQYQSKDELGETADNINELLETIHGAITDVNMVMSEISGGVFKRKIEHDYQGDFLTLKQGVNQSYDQIFNIVQMLRETSSNLKDGVLKTTQNDQVVLKGDYKSVVDDLNIAMDTMRLTVENIADTLDYLSHGDFSKRVQVEAKGSFVLLKDGINETLDSLESFVGEVANAQTRISEGDLTQQVVGQYQGKMAILKDSLNSSTRNISGMIAKVSAVSRLVADEANSIAEGSSAVSERIQDQTIELEKTASQMERMTATVMENAEAASTANQVTQDAQTKLRTGVQVMQQAIDSMEEMISASEKINDIITLIDGIAFQTNLLALNAAVEAARAGEHGRGFAVVAGEVRNLAGKSADAAAEIKRLIENSVRISHESSGYVKQTGDALEEVNDSMIQMSDMVSKISEESNAQARDISGVNASIAEIESGTQQNAGLIEESAAGSQDLMAQSSELLQLVNSFTVDESMMNRITRIQNSGSAHQFEKMVEAHLAWKGKIRAFVEGVDIGVTYEVATDPKACVLGKWYYSEGQNFMHIPEMVALGEAHAEMHAAIKTVMDAKAVDDAKLVEEGLATVDQQSQKVVSLLQAIEDQLI